MRKKATSENDSFDTTLETSIDHNYNVGVHPESWVLPNRVKFGNWIDTTFKYKNKKLYPYCHECEEGESCPMSIKINSMSLFPHQDFIKDYIQFASPYRGLLVYHGLGSGKTCSSIAAAEMLMNHTDVMVMLPASLRSNYINEIKKCGCNFYNLRQEWVFVDTESQIKKAQKALKVSAVLVKKHKGVWIPLPNGTPNYNSLPTSSKNQIDAQIEDIIEQRYNFLNYNGLQRKTINKLIQDGKNPFDNKAIIIDEIHNLVSRIANGRLIGSAMYKLLMRAKHCKIILLSGTPIINYPFEIAYIINLITGPLNYYELKANKNSSFNREEIENTLLANTYVDDFTIDVSSRKVTVYLVPESFHVVDRQKSKIARYNSDIITHETILERLIETMKKEHHVEFAKKITTKQTSTLPEKKDDFNNLFINEEAGSIRNPTLFMRRVLGTVSYYNTFSPELFPSWKVEEVNTEMNTHQFNTYEKARSDERKKEKSSNKNKRGADNGIFSSSGQVYRFFSRAICNFVFPDEIKRPFPSKLSDMKDEIGDDDDILEALDDVDNTKAKDQEGGQGEGEVVKRGRKPKVNDDNAEPVKRGRKPKVVSEVDEEIVNQKQLKRKKLESYHTLLEECLKKLRENKHKYLSQDVLAKLSPKFHASVERILESEGNVLVYSQFRKVEGLGILGMALETNGWKELKVKYENDEWDLDVDEKDIGKPMFASFTGNNDESKILLKIYNNDFEGLSSKILNKLKGQDNLHGEIIKVFMITQSGAEGISLKNTRQVHILEPYWNHIRIDQVIGRAIRTCSHVALPENERNVKVFIYISAFTKEQKESSFTIRTQDHSMTSDEHLFSIAKKKKKIIDGLQDLLKRASVDCTLNAKHHGIKCFAFPVNMDENKFFPTFDINLEEQDTSFEKGVEQKEWKGQLLKTKKGNFVIKAGTNEVYDYNMYLESGKVVKVGTITQDGIKRVIKFVN